MDTNMTAPERLLQMQMFAKSRDVQKIMQQFGQHPLFLEMCAMSEQFQHMFTGLQKAVPELTLESLRTNQRLQQAKPRMYKKRNIIHVPFEKLQNQPPMIIALQENDECFLRIAKIHLFPLIELCALEQRDVYLLVDGEKPIVFHHNAVTYDAFERFMALTTVHTKALPLQQFTQYAMMKKLQQDSQLMLVQLTGEALRLTAADSALLTDWQRVFNFSIKGMFMHEAQLTNAALFDEVYFMGESQ